MKTISIFHAVVIFLATVVVTKAQDEYGNSTTSNNNNATIVQVQQEVASGNGTTGILVARIGRYPGYGGRRAPIGDVAVSFQSGNPQLTFHYAISGLPRNCSRCGVHIHEGMTCRSAELVLGHFWNRDGGRPDPWFPEFGAFYDSNLQGKARGKFPLATGFGLLTNRDRAVVFHAQDGARIGCGVLRHKPISNGYFTRYPVAVKALATIVRNTDGAASAAVSTQSGLLFSRIGRYPGYSGEQAPSGAVAVAFQKGSPELTFHYKIRGLPRNCSQCGVHIHEGRTCRSADLVLGHYWNRDDNNRTDPWFPEFGAFYDSNLQGVARGKFPLATGFGLLPNRDRAVVFHAQDGARIGCGVLRHKGSPRYYPTAVTRFVGNKQGIRKAKQASGAVVSTRSGTLAARIGRYPGYTGEQAPSGMVSVSFQRGSPELKFRYRISGLPFNCSQCGVHIHAGRTCLSADLVLGHYWNNDDSNRPDPWFPEFGAFYDSNLQGVARGEFPLASGFGFLPNRNRAVVFHAQNGTRIGCGVLRERRFFRSSPGYRDEYDE